MRTILRVLWRAAGAFLFTVFFVRPAAAQPATELINQLRSRDSSATRRAVAEIMTSSWTFAPELAKALDDPDPEMRKKCLRLLGKIDRPDTHESVARAVTSDKEWMVRHEAIWALNEMRSNDLSSVERALYDDSQPMNRIIAVRVLSFRLRNASIPQLQGALKDDSLLVKLAAARELGRYGVGSGKKLARSSLDDADWKIRAAAAEALATSGKESDIPSLKLLAENDQENQQVRVKSAQAISNIEFRTTAPAQQVSFLESALGSSEWAVRTWAADVLYQRGDDDSRRVLAAAIEDKDHVGNEQARQALLRIEAKR